MDLVSTGLRAGLALTALGVVAGLGPGCNPAQAGKGSTAAKRPPARSSTNRDARWPAYEDYAVIPERLVAAGRASAEPTRAVELASQTLDGASELTAGLARIVRGQAFYRQGQFRSAVTDLLKAEARSHALEDFVGWLIADSLFRVGDYRQAEARLKGFGQKHPRSSWRHRAVFRLADCQYARGAYAEAASTLRMAIARYPEYPHGAAARHMLGEAERRQGRLQSAANELQRLIDEHPGDPMALISGETLAALKAQGISPTTPTLEETYRIGYRLRRLKYFHRALAKLQPILTDARAKWRMRRRARWQIGRALFGLERYEEAYQSFRALARDAPAGSTRRRALRWTAYALERMGQIERAVTALSTAAGFDGSAGARRRRKPPELLNDLAWLYFNGAKYPQAAELYDQLAKRGGAWARQTRWLRAWLSYRLGDYGAAAEVFGQLQAQTRWRPERYAYWRARALGSEGETRGAAEIYRDILQSAPLSYYAYQARERLGELGLGDDLPTALLADADLIASRARADDFGFGLPCAGDEDESERGVAEKPRSSARPDSSHGPEKKQCVSRCYQGCGGRSTPAGGSIPRGDRRSIGVCAPSHHRALCSPDDEMERADRVRSDVDLNREEPIIPGRSDVAPQRLPDPSAALDPLARGWGLLFPALVRAHQFAVIGEDELASAELRAVSDELRAFRKARRSAVRWRYAHNPYLDHREGVEVAEWGRQFDDRGPPANARRGRRLAARLPGSFWDGLRTAYAALGDAHYFRRHFGARKLLRGRPDTPQARELWGRFYPRAFARLVERGAAKYGLDRHFVWAIMTVESSFQAQAVSRAGARGLMQVMPHTAGLIADRMDMRNFGTALLFEPAIAIELGTWYLSELLTKFDGQLPLAIAGYNAGPHRVAAWLVPKGHLPMDEFVEEIPYREAREYTKKVLRYLMLYRLIYEEPAEFEVSQTINPMFRDNINF